jgi:hypothetical protein
VTLDDIGIGAPTYDTPQQWWDAQPNDEFTEEHIGECLAEEFTAAFDFNGKLTTAAFYGELRAKAGAEHDGRHHGISGLGNARFNTSGTVSSVRLRDNHVRVAWMEVQGPGNNNVPVMAAPDGFVSAGSQFYIHHNILHNDWASTGSDNSGFQSNDADARIYLYRNIFFGVGGTGIRTDSGASGSVIFYNTVYGTNRNFTGTDNSRGGIAVGSGGDTNYAMRYNAAFRNRNADIRLTRGVQNYNYSSDGTADDEGANSVANVDADAQFVSPIDVSGATATWSSLDLLLLSGSTLRGAGVSESNATYPEIDVPINDRSYTITGTWDIGAAQYIPAGGGAFNAAMASIANPVLGVGVY